MMTPEIKAMLSADLDRSAVATRQQAGQTLSYITAWHAISEANRIFGFDGWTRETVYMQQVRDPQQIDGKWRVGYIAKVKVVALGAVREGTGYGSGIAKDLGDAYESAVKEAESDAMKRALITFGNVFGLALYDKTHANVSDTSKPKISAAKMKEGLADIDHDLVDCVTINDVNTCAKTWASIMERDGWTKDYIDFAKPKFQQRRDAINAASAPQVNDPSEIPFD